jgi:cell division transport system ATP-binding protein
VIQLRSVGKRYRGGKDALTDVSFEIGRGELVFLTGPSGSGKTTLFKLLSLMERPTRGQILVDGTHLERLATRAIPRYRRRLGLIFQGPRLLTDRTIFENVALPLAIEAAPPREIKERVTATLRRLDLAPCAERLPGELSAGEQHRAAIARAIVHSPELLLADEPTANVDPELARASMRLLEQLRAGGMTILIATHDVALREGTGGRQIQLEAGHVVESRHA